MPGQRGQQGQPGQQGQQQDQQQGQQQGGQQWGQLSGEAQRLREQYPTFWDEGTDQPAEQMPSDGEIDRMEEIQVERGDDEDERETPAFAQEHAEKMRGRDRWSYQE